MEQMDACRLSLPGELVGHSTVQILQTTYCKEGGTFAVDYFHCWGLNVANSDNAWNACCRHWWRWKNGPRAARLFKYLPRQSAEHEYPWQTASMPENSYWEDPARVGHCL